MCACFWSPLAGIGSDPGNVQNPGPPPLGSRLPIRSGNEPGGQRTQRHLPRKKRATALSSVWHRRPRGTIPHSASMILSGSEGRAALWWPLQPGNDQTPPLPWAHRQRQETSLPKFQQAPSQKGQSGAWAVSSAGKSMPPTWTNGCATSATAVTKNAVFYTGHTAANPLSLSVRIDTRREGHGDTYQACEGRSLVARRSRHSLGNQPSDTNPPSVVMTASILAPTHQFSRPRPGPPAWRSKWMPRLRLDFDENLGDLIRFMRWGRRTRLAVARSKRGNTFAQFPLQVV